MLMDFGREARNLHTCTEELQDLQRFIIAEVLDEVSHVSRDNADVTRHVVKGARITFSGEDGDSGTTADEEGPTPSTSACAYG